MPRLAYQRDSMLFTNVLRQLQRDLDAVAEARGLTQPRYDLLLLLGGQPEPLRVGEVARILNCSLQWLSISVRDLRKRGLVRTRRCADDGRVRLLELTAKGRREEAAFARVVKARFEGGMRASTAVEREGWRSVTRRLARPRGSSA